MLSNRLQTLRRHRRLLILLLLLHTLGVGTLLRLKAGLLLWLKMALVLIIDVLVNNRLLLVIGSAHLCVELREALLLPARNWRQVLLD